VYILKDEHKEAKTLFFIGTPLHYITVDCGRGMVFDSTKKWSTPLTINSLAESDILEDDIDVFRSIRDKDPKTTVDNV
jgi:hypothetical protein